jgi:serine/threonine-protein kinase
MQLTRLGPYEIEKPLGKGGMGSVYAATDSQTGQRVAIKALTPQLAMADLFDGTGRGCQPRGRT